MRIIRVAAESQIWTELPERLIALRALLAHDEPKAIDGHGWAEAAFDSVSISLRDYVDAGNGHFINKYDYARGIRGIGDLDAQR